MRSSIACARPKHGCTTWHQSDRLHCVCVFLATFRSGTRDLPAKLAATVASLYRPSNCAGAAIALGRYALAAQRCARAPGARPRGLLTVLLTRVNLVKAILHTATVSVLLLP